MPHDHALQGIQSSERGLIVGPTTGRLCSSADSCCMHEAMPLRFAGVPMSTRWSMIIASRSFDWIAGKGAFGPLVLETNMHFDKGFCIQTRPKQ